MLNVTLSRDVRNAVQALVRQQPGFEAFRQIRGAFDSRNMNKELTLEAVEHFGLESTVLEMVADAANKANTQANADAVNDAFADGRILASTAAILSGESSMSEIEMAESVLAPLKPFLSPVLLDTVATALAPIVALAAKPPVETVRTVTLDASGNTVEIVCDEAKRCGSSTLGKLFGLSRFKHSSTYMSLWDANDAPPVDPFFTPEPNVLSKIVSALDPDPSIGRKPRPVWLAGQAGTGKTTMPEQIAARAKRPFVRIAFQRAVEPTDLLGMLGLDGKGGMAWRDGILTRAIRRPGTVILLDEITFAPPGLAAVLQTLLDTRKLYLPTGELVECAEGVVFCCADNTAGYGDDTGVYGGTTVANAALIDRMARLIKVDYLPPEIESQALANHTGALKEACRRVVDFVNSARRLPGFDARPLSLRRMIAFVEMVNDNYTVTESFDDCVLSRLPDAERETLRIHYKAAFDEGAFKADLDGKGVQPGASDDPTQAACRAAFDIVDGDA